MCHTDDRWSKQETLQRIRHVIVRQSIITGFVGPHQILSLFPPRKDVWSKVAYFMLSLSLWLSSLSLCFSIARQRNITQFFISPRDFVPKHNTLDSGLNHEQQRHPEYEDHSRSRRPESIDRKSKRCRHGLWDYRWGDVQKKKANPKKYVERVRSQRGTRSKSSRNRWVSRQGERCFKGAASRR